MSCHTPYRGDTSQLLLFKIASCLAGGDESGPVQSFNGRGGVVTLQSSDITDLVDSRYVKKAGDTMTGALTIGNGSIAASAPVLNLSQTWNNAAVSFTGLLFNATNTASASGSNLFDFQQSAVSLLSLRTDGRLTLVGRLNGVTGAGLANVLTVSSTANTSIAPALMLAHSLSSGTAGVGFGTRFDMVGDSNGSTGQILLRIDTSWTDSVQATRSSTVAFAQPVGGTNVSTLILTGGQVQVRDGTAALPALTFGGDPDNGLYRIGTNNLGLAVGGSLLVSYIAGGVTVTGGTITTSQPTFSGSQTWNAGGVTFTGFLNNITDTASVAGSMLFDFQKNSLSVFHGDNGGNYRFLQQAQTNTAVQLFLRKRGNSTDSTGAIASGAGLGTLFFSGWNGAANVQGASVRGIATEAFTGSVNGTRVDIFATATATNTSVVVGSFQGEGFVLSKSFNVPYVAKTGTYTITESDYTIDCTANSFTVNLPTAVNITGRIYVVKNSGAGSITLDANGSQTIDGALTQTIAAGAAMRVQSNGANWIII